jgi:prophage regulatory protein
MASRVLRLRSVIDLTGLSRSSTGYVPRQVSLGARAVGWRESNIQTWLDNLSVQ